MDLEKPNYIVPDYMPVVYDKLPQPPSHREAIVNSCVFVHQTLHQANARLAKRGGRTMAITPRHYLDFINHYANLFNEKRSELEEQQMHLNVGLRKIKETVDQVEELRRDLRIKSQELEVKNAAANDKLKKMVKDQQEAEKKKVMSQEIQEQLHKQQEVIADKQMSVKEDLDKLNYADMLKRVEPLRNELQKLEDDAKDNQQKANEVEQMIRDLEASIARYKEEYAVLISEAQAIKADLAAVEAKVNRSTALLKSLSAERERWEKTSETFKNQMSTIAGDCLLSGAFIAYAGYFDQQMRQNLFTTWSHHLQQANIQFRTDIARTEYLSNADERLRWQASSLPADDLCTENAIMLKRFNRYFILRLKGRILDDDTIITTLENLKKEAAEVTRKVEETDIVMQEVETVSQQYLPLSTACSSIYFTMESLKQIHFLYQYSLQFFLDIYHNVLYENPNLKGITDHTHRLSIITKDLFQVQFFN
ncbi:cytoplasmic dynein 1 heavy chain 1 [Limosa lapponica baueri]|uniref:Cytoplasmic dynein 1 heavy chain 1 n=1 Tax=Limosa lapponica baueri TaxID=1758121 RepID=A0A2I0T5J4_LIMLA|nr:cytoplasmic dynein 1 heavy chain 1 [Limosa lapponica baueri]